MSTPNVHISRSFVEFGPFLAEEIIQFDQRGLLREIDHIRLDGEDVWHPVAAWLASVSVKPQKTASTAKPKAPSASKVATPKKAAPKPPVAAKKAPKRKAPKEA